MAIGTLAEHVFVLYRRAKEAAAASEQEAAAAAGEAEHATWQVEQGEAGGIDDDEAHALRQAAAKWSKRYTIHTINWPHIGCHGMG